MGNILLLCFIAFSVMLMPFCCCCFCFVSFSFTAPGSALGSDDIIAGNVSKYTVLPAGYCGQPRKGHLVFDACFESGKHL